MKKTQNFTEGSIFAPLVRFALPVLLALLLQTMYGAVDLLVVGQFGTSADVSAVSWFMSRQAVVELFHIGMATPISTLVQILLCGGYFFLLLRRRQREERLQEVRK